MRRKGMKKSNIGRTYLKELNCSKCGKLIKNVNITTDSILCGRCTQIQDLKMFGVPREQKMEVKSTKPAGWHFMTEFVDLNGDYYKKGKLIENKTDKIPTLNSKVYLDKIAEQKNSKLSKNEKYVGFMKHSAERDVLKKEITKLIKAKASKVKIKKIENKLNKVNKLLKKYL